MPLERDVILVENLRECLRVYDRALVWAMTASSVFFLLSLRMGEKEPTHVDFLYTKLSVPIAWIIALGLFLVLGGFALTALRQAEQIVEKFGRPAKDYTPQPNLVSLLEEVVLYPSLATNRNTFFRIGTVLFSPVAVVTGFVIEMTREWAGRSWFDIPWLAAGMMLAIVIASYATILFMVLKPFGSHRWLHTLS